MFAKGLSFYRANYFFIFMYTLKQLPQDFVVKEISNIEIKPSGKYLYFLLKKTQRNTPDVVKELAKQLGVKEKQIGFAGNKDKQAVTEQTISVFGVNKNRMEKIKIDKVELKFLGYGEERINLGDLGGNQFEIVIRNLDKYFLNKTNLFPNYFDEQRFGGQNKEIGRCLVKKDFSQALELIQKNRSDGITNSNNPIGTLQQIPLRLLRIYVNAYQSYLWNKTLAEYLRQKGTVEKEISYSQGELVFVKEPEKFSQLMVPLVGFGSEELETPETQSIIKEIMKLEQLNYRDFVIKSLPQLSPEGELRKGFTEIKDLKIGKEEADELNPGKKKIKLSFFLDKGSYATMAVRQIINTS